MITNIEIIFTGGSGGNFISRCLNLLNNFYGYVDENQELLTDIESKYKRFNYQSVIGKTFWQRNWLRFEHINSCSFDEFLVRTNNINVKRYFLSRSHVENHLNPEYDLSDEKTYFFIDPYECVEWTVKNSMYKNTPTSMDVINLGRHLLNVPRINLINLKNIINNEETFSKEFLNICNIVGYIVSDEELSVVKKLYNEWKLTQFDDSKISEFRIPELTTDHSITDFINLVQSRYRYLTPN